MFRRAKQALTDYIYAVRSAVSPPSERMIVAFSDASAIDRFQVTTDVVLGGSTKASFSLKQLGNLSCGRFQGVIIPPNYGDRPNRGGFASFRTKSSEPVVDLEAFEGIEMRVKTDGRGYILNVKCADHHPEDLFQGRILVPPFQWVTIAIKFSELVLTSRGTVQLMQHPVSTGLVNGFGILLADNKPGPFLFEVQYLKAILRLPEDEFISLPSTTPTAPALDATTAEEDKGDMGNPNFNFTLPEFPAEVEEEEEWEKLEREERIRKEREEKNRNNGKK